MDATEMLELFNDFLEEGPEIVSTPIVETKGPAASDSDNQEELVSRGNQDSDDEGWEEGYTVGDAVEKDSVDDDQTSCASFDAAPGARGITPTSARGSNCYQKRQKEELKYLKSRVRELEDELRRVDEDNHTKPGNSMWQRVAQQQSVARQQSAVDDPVDQPRRRRKLMTSTFSDELHADVAREYLRVNQMFATTGAVAMSTDCHSVRVKSKRDPKSPSGDVLRIEMLVARRFPFRFKAVADIIWAFLSDASNLTKMGGMRRNVEVSNESILATTHFTFPVGERSAEIKATAAFKKSPEPGFVVMNWVSDGECRAKRSSRSAFKVVEKGWTKIEALPGDSGSCILRTVSQLNPTISAPDDENAASDQSRSPLTDLESTDGSVNSEEIGILSELILGAYAKTTGRIYAEVQNVLMEQALAKSS